MSAGLQKPEAQRHWSLDNGKAMRGILSRICYDYCQLLVAKLQELEQQRVALQDEAAVSGDAAVQGKGGGTS
ncbi:hypothetical protein HaLaN_00900 [Haematococcus lacustris]|uniref:Uncharacterized protein n=1 Tax=Haematococcus lacustris TaxID=44745 RepID=A0A699Y8A1_HAELA|nr:hypothetical protein HaLaN_00900 [Haematococcus lacustris]